MIGDLIAALVGHHIDHRDGEDGTLGAIAGVATWELAKRVVPVAIVIGGAAIGYHYLTRRPAAPSATG